MKRALLAASAALLLGTAVSACSQPYGPGMMGGYGPGGNPNYEQGRGYGPGGGYGPGYGYGPGMMGGYYGHMGRGMMGGYGPGYGMGPGMMGGYGGYGPGYGMGPGMMGGYGGYGYGYGLNLSDEQRSKIVAIQREDYEKRWKLMDKMHEEGGPMDLMWGPYDEKAARKAYQQMAEAQKEMFELNLQTRKRIDAVLTPEQREQMQRGWRGRGPR